MGKDVIVKSVEENVNVDDSFFNPFVIDSLEGCYLFFEILEEPNYVFKHKRQLQRKILEVIEWFFKRIGQPYSKRYPPMLPNGEKVELLDLYMFVKAVLGFKLEEKYTLDTCNNDKNEAKGKEKEPEVMEGNVMELDTNLTNIVDENIGEFADVSAAKNSAEIEDKNNQKAQETPSDSQGGSFGGNEDFFKELEDFVLIEDKEC
ncbi:hypothetical protein E3N88_38917 [Mikania micrantha]|uniref:Uncharacterized protein n=1 Tax=Mikania micrantha TaxID=192012 RepID=A0A5N6LVI4_9ASTR|nr:hypothetical protein E3N88_38917 [Mikania micrantha]